MDLRLALKCCRLLVQDIDNINSRFGALGSELTTEASIILAFEDKTFKEYFTKLDHQLSALSLYLVAFRWYGNPRSPFLSLTPEAGAL